jgi:hypothetical protein
MLVLHVFSIRKEFVRKMTIEEHSFPGHRAYDGNACRELVDEIDVVAGRPGCEEVSGEVELAEVSEEDVE